MHRSRRARDAKPQSQGACFVAHDKDRIKQIRGDIQSLATETGLEIGEYRKLVHSVTR